MPIGPGAGLHCAALTTGPRCRQIVEDAIELSSAPCTSSRSRPRPFASSMASAVAAMCVASSMLATYFRLAPVPNSPV